MLLRPSVNSEDLQMPPWSGVLPREYWEEESSRGSFEQLLEAPKQYIPEPIRPQDFCYCSVRRASSWWYCMFSDVNPAPWKLFFSKPIVPPRAALLHRARLKLCANLQDTYCVSHLRLDREDNKIPKRHSPVQVLFRTLFWNWGSIAHAIQNRVQPMAPNFFAIVVFSWWYCMFSDVNRRPEKWFFQSRLCHPELLRDSYCRIRCWLRDETVDMKLALNPTTHLCAFGLRDIRPNCQKLSGQESSSLVGTIR